MIPELSPSSPIKTEPKFIEQLDETPLPQATIIVTEFEYFNRSNTSEVSPIAVSYELEGDISADKFLSSVAEFIGDTGFIPEGSIWNGRYGIEIAAVNPHPRGDDEEYFEQQAPLDMSPVKELKGGTHDPEGSPRIWIGAGVDSYQEFELKRNKDLKQLKVTLGLGEFKDREDLENRVSNLFQNLTGNQE